MNSDLSALIPRDKLDVRTARKVVARGYPAVAPILPELLEWVKDMNWPVAEVLAPFFAGIGLPLAHELRRILRTEDTMWKYWVLTAIVAESPPLAATLHEDILRIAGASAANEDEEEVRARAADILRGLNPA